MGTAEETTNFPPAYVQLDAKVDKLRVIFDGLLRVTRQLYSSDDYSTYCGWVRRTFDIDMMIRRPSD